MKVFAPRWTRNSCAVNRCRALAATGLEHPGLPFVLGTGWLPGGRFFVVERWIEGVPLERLAERSWEPRLAMETVAAIADAVDELHRHSIAHQTLNAAKVLVTRQRVHVTGCFAAPLLNQAGKVDEDRPTGLVASSCSIDCIAPESGTSEGSFRSADIYALGVLAFRLLAGAYPFPRRSTVVRAIVDRRQHTAPTLARLAGRSFPDPLENLIARALTRDPAMRPATAAAFAAELRRVWSQCAGAGRGRELPAGRAGIDPLMRPNRRDLSIVRPAPEERDAPVLGPLDERTTRRDLSIVTPVQEERDARVLGPQGERPTRRDLSIVTLAQKERATVLNPLEERPTRRDLSVVTFAQKESAMVLDGLSVDVMAEQNGRNEKRVPSEPPSPRVADDELVLPMRWNMRLPVATALILIAAVVIAVLSTTQF